MFSTAADQLRNLLNGYRNTALLYVAAKLGIATALAERPRTATELAMLVGADAPTLARILRGLCVLGVCKEVDDEQIRLTPLGKALLPGAPGGLHALAILTGEEYAASWMNLLHSAKTGELAFDHVFAMSPWEHREKNPELNACFNEWLGASTGDVSDSIVAAYDFSRFGSIADVGGGHGALIARILKMNPSMRGILFDRQHVLDSATSNLERTEVADRCALVAGDFFVLIPVRADAIILKSVLHDWDDQRCLQILRNCRAATRGEQRLLIIERILPTRAIDDPAATMIDLHMLAVTGGRERNEEEYHALLKSAGFEIVCRSDATCGFSNIEARPSEK